MFPPAPLGRTFVANHLHMQTRFLQIPLGDSIIILIFARILHSKKQYGQILISGGYRPVC